MKHRRVKITGIGPITPGGSGREAFLRGMLEPVSHVGPLRFAEDGREVVTAAAAVKDFRVGAYGLDAAHLRSARDIQFALGATVLALRDAGISLAEAKKRRPLVMMGASAFETDRAAACAPTMANPEGTARRCVADFVGARTDTVAMETGSVLEAVGRAAERIASGEVDLAVCGGVETPLTPEHIEQLKKEGLASKHARDPGRQCRPFDLWRTTGVLGEGACMFVLEAETSAHRGYVRVAGWAQAADAGQKPWSGLAEALRLGLANARLRPAGVDCIHTEGTGNKLLDVAEAAALSQGFGPRLASIPAVASKGALGNALGAAEAIQVGCAALSMRHSVIPPSVNWHHPDPACPLNLSAGSRLLATESSVVVARSLSGVVSCLLLRA